ncbi:carbon-nitrogen hydrolase family protein [Jiangella rhizosphaerae]|uniref:Carbon-nitrogen hydrolase family protein n=1 Tax=Jiangella rhizosphaerae TaxID=2293569 RepID=A0A418KVJ8_9ACTN|nr:carbon-nitrogen hydrolase family protein [Jiangella rhizosphaerae]RIQ32479.1 carbon-nitrogen hydrolase family protein [Jiangella rhizosphaerae]
MTDGSDGGRLPRMVVVGTTVFGGGAPFPGVLERSREVSGLVDRMAAAASGTTRGGLDLVVLPELVAGPPGPVAVARALPLDHPVLEVYGSMARRHRTYLVVTLDLADGGAVWNAAVLLDRAGDVVGVYRKAHPVAATGSSSFEGGVTPGTSFPVFACDFGAVGIQICWDVMYDDGWQALAAGGAEMVAFPSASPATVRTAAHAARHRYYVVSSTPRDNAAVYEPSGLVAARLLGPGVLVHELDLSYAVLGWSASLRDGLAFREAFGDRAGYHYSPREDVGLFWSNDPATPIDAMTARLGVEDLRDQVARNASLRSRPIAPATPS